MILSKTLELSDYEDLGQYSQYVRSMWHLPSRREHQHRQWEYSITCAALDKYDVETAVDVGGGGSLLAPILTLAGVEVLQVDPADNEWLISAQQLMIERKLPYEMERFENWHPDTMYDAVLCISVLEHVPDDMAMFRKLMSHAGKVVVITVDFSPTGQPVIAGHIRTYNEEMMEGFIAIASEEGFTPAGGEYDYSKPGDHVYGYNFASLVLVK